MTLQMLTIHDIGEKQSNREYEEHTLVCVCVCKKSLGGKLAGE